MNDAVEAIAAHVFAASVTFIVATFDTPRDLIRAIWSEGDVRETVSAPLERVLPDLLTGIDCLEWSSLSSQAYRDTCLDLIALAAEEMGMSKEEVPGSVMQASEAFRLAAAKTCRDLWLARGTPYRLPVVASCLLSTPHLAFEGVSQ